jgi:hypothetical protein
VLRALPNLKKLDNIEVTIEEVRDAQNASLQQQAPQTPPKEDVYEDDYETTYRHQTVASNFRGHSPVREVI